jgi:hypothetical protein
MKLVTFSRDSVREALNVAAERATRSSVEAGGARRDSAATAPRPATNVPTIAAYAS